MQSHTSSPSLVEGVGGKKGHGYNAPTATPTGGRSFASPAMIRILLTPAHAQVTPDEFEMMAGAIRRTESIRLSDLPKSQIRNDAVPATSALGKTGEVLLSFVTSYDQSHSFLAPFDLHRQVLGVIGLSMVNPNTDMEDLRFSPTALRQLHPGAVTHRVFGFDTGAARTETIDLSSVKNASELIEAAGQAEAGPSNSSSKAGFSSRDTSGLVIFPSVRKDYKDVRFYLKTLLPDFVGTLLDGLDNTIKGLQGKPLETPRETLDGIIATANQQASSSNRSTSISTNSVGTAASRASSIFSSFSSSEEKRSSTKSNRSSKTSSIAANVGPLGAGRYGKVKADYYLLAGDLWNALHTYDSCMNLLGKEKALVGGQDAVWFASALEGWAVARYLVARMGGAVEERASCLTLPHGGIKEKDKEKEKDKVEFQYHDKSWSDIAEAYSLALTIYTKCLAPISYLLDSGKSITPDTPRDYTHPLIHTSACLAYSRLLLAIWASGGWNPETFDQLLYGGVPPVLVETIRPTPAVYAQHCTSSGVQRSDIAAAASLAMTNSSTNGLKLLDQIHLYSSLAALYGAIGFTRREAYSIRRLQVLVVSLIASGIALQKTEPSISSQVIKDVHLNTSEQVAGTMVSTRVSNGSCSNSESILVLALQICQSYGIQIEKMPVNNLDKGHILSRAAITLRSGKELSTPQLSRGEAEWSQPDAPNDQDQIGYEVNIKEEQQDLALMNSSPHFGWVSLQIPIFQEAIAICEMMQGEAAMLFFATIFLRDLWSYLTPEDQIKLKEGIAIVQRSLLAKGRKLLLEYWGPTSLLDDMQLISPVENITSRDVQSIGSRNEPRKMSKGVHSTVKRSSMKHTDQIFDGDLVSFYVTLFNPLSVSLEFESIQLDVVKSGSVGPSFKALEATSIVIAPTSHHTIVLSGTPHGEGKLLLKGIIVKMSFCASKRFAFERIDGENKEILARLQSDYDDAYTRIKAVGLEARNEVDQAGIQRPKRKMDEQFHLIQVIAQIPRLVMQGSNAIWNGLIVLYDGEEKTIQISVRNRSKIKIDYIQFDLEDDLQSEMLDILAEGRLDPVHVYELEDDLLHRPFITSSVENSQGLVSPGEMKTFSFIVKGKLDVCRACINVEYGNIQGAKELGREQFWTRRAKFEFHVQVLPVVSIDGFKVMEGAGKEMDKQVMLSMRVQNMHSCGIELDWQIADNIVHRHLAPNSTCQIHFDIPRLSLSNEEIEKAIPTLMERQFIFTSRDETSAEERMIKTQFWTKRAMLELIKSHKWKDAKMKREGEINLGGLVLPNDARLLSKCRQCPLQLQTKFSKTVEKFDFVDFIALVENTSDAGIKGQYRLMPIVQERLSNHIQCTSGHLHGHIHSSKGLSLGELCEIRIGLCFLSSGTFPLLFNIVQDDMIIIERRIEVNVP